MKKVVIARDLDRRLEHAVFVINESLGIQGWINPKVEISKATGVQIPRYSCIVSFACGLQAAGYEVEMVQPILGARYPIRYTFQHSGQVVLVYHLLGRCFGLFQWDRFKSSLRQLPPQQRFAVMEKTAKYYIDRPWEQDIRLVI
jgi:hypothetical protein